MPTQHTLTNFTLTIRTDRLSSHKFDVGRSLRIAKTSLDEGPDPHHIVFTFMHSHADDLPRIKQVKASFHSGCAPWQFWSHICFYLFLCERWIWAVSPTLSVARDYSLQFSPKHFRPFSFPYRFFCNILGIQIWSETK